MRNVLSLFAIASASLLLTAIARENAVPVEGLHQNTPRVHALANAKIVVSPTKTLENGTIVIRDGLIESVGANINIPSDARVRDLDGKIVYPGFIDAYTHFGMPAGLKPQKPRNPYAEGPPPKPAPTPKQLGASYWNPLVTPERDASTYYSASKKDAESMHSMGFTTAAVFPGRGIFRGQGILASLNGKPVNEATIDSKIAQHLAFEIAQRDPSTSSSPYPTSLMGSIALIRQALYDADWQSKVEADHRQNPNALERPVANAALANLAPLIDKKQIGLFVAHDELDYQRIAKIADEFSIQYAILGNGYEYRQAENLQQIGSTVITPLAFPKAPRADEFGPSLDISLERLQHWDFAPSNPAFLAKSGIPFCLTSYALSDPDKTFWERMRKAVQRGLSESDALNAITVAPATLYGIEKRLGTIESGKIANLVIASDNLFLEKSAQIEGLWIDGDYTERKSARMKSLGGKWVFTWQDVEGFESAEVSDTNGKLNLQFEKRKIPLTQTEKEIRFNLDQSHLGIVNAGTARLQAYIDIKEMNGLGYLADGTTFSWSAVRNNEPDTEPSSEAEDKSEDPPPLVFDRYPAGAYGVGEFEQPDIILIQNATIWTSGPDGILENSDLLIRRGKIDRIGRNLRAPRGATIIDGAGKHITPGLIDCHSHTAMSRGVNEAGSASTVEVRVADIVNPADINLYRQLAGGLTTSNLLHGSANPMGGQNQVIKLRWGEDAEGMLLKTARPGVKFALGENVKQSNWGDDYTVRYPQTRMGVEQFMESSFQAAAEYEREWADFRSGASKKRPRKNLRLEATLEILNGDRDVHIHSYRQDEILMFARLARRLNFNVATFQHILEGYKVADAMVEINAGGSSFSDWWAYKFEVYDAIPYNGAMMHRAGVLTSFNSDNAELATRMNTEAAKAVKYGRVSEEEALKFVTLNPAIQLGIDDRVGSLETGKDGDFVIWTDHPLSTFAAAEQTWIEGVKRFDKEEHLEKAEAAEAERNALIQKVLSQSPKPPDPKSEESASDTPDPPQIAHFHNHTMECIYHDGTHYHEASIEWIYHDGTRHYSCSGLEEEGH